MEKDEKKQLQCSKLVSTCTYHIIKISVYDIHSARDKIILCFKTYNELQVIPHPLQRIVQHQIQQLQTL